MAATGRRRGPPGSARTASVKLPLELLRALLLRFTGGREPLLHRRRVVVERVHPAVGVADLPLLVGAEAPPLLGGLEEGFPPRAGAPRPPANALHPRQRPPPRAPHV